MRAIATANRPGEIFDLKWFFHFTPFYGDFGAKFLSNYPD
jgi:hypothetical protein